MNLILTVLYDGRMSWSALFDSMKLLWETDNQKRPQRVTRHDEMDRGEMITPVNLSQQ
jgi:hypothetical protein